MQGTTKKVQSYSSTEVYGKMGAPPVLSLRHALSLDPRKIPKSRYELRSELFHCCIFAGNLTRLSAVQSYLCSD